MGNIFHKSNKHKSTHQEESPRPATITLISFATREAEHQTKPRPSSETTIKRQTVSAGLTSGYECTDAAEHQTELRPASKTTLKSQTVSEGPTSGYQSTDAVSETFESSLGSQDGAKLKETFNKVKSNSCETFKQKVQPVKAESVKEFDIRKVEKKLLKVEAIRKRESSTVKFQALKAQTAETEIVIETNTRKGETSTVNVKAYMQSENIPLKKGLAAKHESNIKKNFLLLKKELDPDELTDHLIENGDISDEERDEIEAITGRSNKIDLIQRKLLRFRPDAYDRFLAILSSIGYKHVTQALLREEQPKQLTEKHLLTRDADRIIDANYDELVDQLNPLQLVGYFIVYEVISISEYEAVITKVTREERCKSLLECIKRHLPKAYTVLLHALEDTGDRYMFQKLSNYPLSSPSRNEINTPPEVEVKSGKARAEPLDGREFTLTIKLSGNDTKQTQNDLVSLLQGGEMRLRISDATIGDTGCVINGITNGSIIICLRSCNNLSSAKMHDLCKTGAIRDVLQRIILQPNTMHLFPKGIHNFEVKVKCDQQTVDTEICVQEQRQALSLQDRLNKNIDFLLEELDAISFLKLLEAKRIFSKEEVEYTMDTKPISRLSRTKKMFELLNEKGSPAIDCFVDLLKEKKHKQYILDRLFPSEQSDSLTDVLITEYSFFVRDLLPQDIKIECITQGILSHDCLDEYHMAPRKVQAQFLMQHILVQDIPAQLVFMDILKRNGHLPPSLVLTHCNQKQANPGLGPFTYPVKSMGNEKYSDTLFVGKFFFKIKEEKGKRQKMGKRNKYHRSKQVTPFTGVVDPKLISKCTGEDVYHPEDESYDSGFVGSLSSRSTVSDGESNTHMSMQNENL